MMRQDTKPLGYTVWRARAPFVCRAAQVRHPLCRKAFMSGFNELRCQCERPHKVSANCSPGNSAYR